MEYLHPTKLPVRLRVRRALEDVLFQLDRRETATDSTEFAAMLLDALKHWQAPREDRERLVQRARELSPKGLDFLSIISKLLIPGVELGSEKRSPTATQAVPIIAPEEYYFTVWTEKGTVS